MLSCSEGEVLWKQADLRSGCAYGEGYMGRRLGILLSCPEGEVLWKQADLRSGRAYGEAYMGR